MLAGTSFGVKHHLRSQFVIDMLGTKWYEDEDEDEHEHEHEDEHEDEDEDDGGPERHHKGTD